MTSILVTAFAPYESWKSNASQLCLERLIASSADDAQITTRVYPVDFSLLRERLAADLQADYDYALHLGQARDRDSVSLELFGLNVGCHPGPAAGESFPLEPDGPAAYHCELPLASWAEKLRAAGIAAQVSFHAGTYLCNAAFYWSHFCTEQLGLATRSGFIHLPLDESQVAGTGEKRSCMPSATAAAAVQLILDELGATD